MKGLKKNRKNRRREVSKKEFRPENPDRSLKGIPPDKDPGMGLIGLGSFGKRNLSDHHDQYLTRYARQKKR